MALDGRVDRRRYLAIGESTGVFKPGEMQAFREILDRYEEKPDSDYHILEERDGDHILGYLIFGEAPMTEHTWEIYWIAVDKSHQGRGVGKRLVRKVEDYLADRLGRAVLRIETSSKKEYDSTRSFYQKIGYVEAGRIPNFYAEGDDLVTYYKDIKKSQQNT
jgi:ribosomal protein S18 acetylase RimI-like enzyme